MMYATSDVDQVDGTVYISGNDGQLAVGVPPAAGLPPLSYTLYRPIPTTVDPANIFVAMRVANDHPTGTAPNTVYMTYSDKLVEGSPKNSTSSVPIMPWGNDPVPKCGDWLEK